MHDALKERGCVSTSTPIADMITEMLKNCIPMEMIIVAVRSMERAVSTRYGVDETAEKRRAWDRDYRRRKRGVSTDPPDIHPKPPDLGNYALSSLKEDKKHSEVVIKKEKKRARAQTSTRLETKTAPLRRSRQARNELGRRR